MPPDPGSATLRRLDLARLIRFGLVGLTGVAVNLAVVQVLFTHFHWPAFVASAFAVELSVINNFLWNNWWTFGQRTLSLFRFVRFNLACLGGLLITSGVFTVLVQHLAIHYLVADLIAIAAATGWNFLASTFWTWAQ